MCIFVQFLCGTMRVRSCHFPRRCKQISEYEFAISLAVRKQPNLYKFKCFLTANEIANSYSEICLQRREKRQERTPHRPMQELNKYYTDVFRIFVRFTNLFHKLKYIEYIKKYRRFYFCYYFSVVVKLCKVFSDSIYGSMYR